MFKRVLVLLLAVLLYGCSAINLNFSTPQAQPTFPPKIYTPTSLFTLTASATPVIFTPTPTLTATETFTATITPTPTQAPFLSVDIVGCNTSLDITHGMGEVTNAYPLIQNHTGLALTHVCATLSASDEARLHPDKTACLDLLPPGDQVELKLTVDTGFEQDTSIQVDVTTAEGYTASVNRSSCTAIGLPGSVPLKAGIVEPIP